MGWPALARGPRHDERVDSAGYLVVDEFPETFVIDPLRAHRRDQSGPRSAEYYLFVETAHCGTSLEKSKNRLKTGSLCNIIYVRYRTSQIALHRIAPVTVRALSVRGPDSPLRTAAGLRRFSPFSDRH